MKNDKLQRNLREIQEQLEKQNEASQKENEQDQKDTNEGGDQQSENQESLNRKKIMQAVENRRNKNKRMRAKK